MATAFKIHIDPTNTGLLGLNQSEASAEIVSRLLQEDMEQHHVFFNQDGFHNHIPHHLLALYGTGADPEALQAGYKSNLDYQRPAKASKPTDAESLNDWATMKGWLGKENRYADFLLHFQREIDAKGYQAVVNEYVFAGDERAEAFFQRLFAGFLHPIIQLMYGLEWRQPAMVAEALAQTAVHSNRLKDFLEASEKKAADAPTPMPAIRDLIKELAQSETLFNAPQWSDANKNEGTLKRAFDEMVSYAAKVKINPDELEERTAEMFHETVAVATGAAIHPKKKPLADFFLMHHVNASPVFVTINNADWISHATKVRLLEYKIRLDLLQYVSRRSLKARFDDVLAYKPKDKELVRQPKDLFPNFHPIPDDGHTIKLIRAFSVCRDLGRKFTDKPWNKIRTDEDWVKVNYLIYDGEREVGPTGPTSERWIRSAGFEEAWAHHPDVE